MSQGERALTVIWLLLVSLFLFRSGLAAIRWYLRKTRN